MVLTLYQDDRDPYKVYNVIEVTVDNLRTLAVKVKHGVHISRRSYRHEEDYQRLTLSVD